MFLCELDGYAPAGGNVRGKPTLTLVAFDARLRTFLLDVYHRRECAETKIPPVERWEANGFYHACWSRSNKLDLLLLHALYLRLSKSIFTLLVGSLMSNSSMREWMILDPLKISST